jgi:DNA-binding winged helix-turn-helix (wHTH) protein
LAIQSATAPGVFRFGDDFVLDVRAYELRSAGIPLKLKPIPMELLMFLIERRGELVTREQIVERIWGKGVFLDTDNSINGAISRIRQVLREDAAQPRFVQTVTGRGYRFIAPVTAFSSCWAAAVWAWCTRPRT